MEDIMIVKGASTLPEAHDSPNKEKDDIDAEYDTITPQADIDSLHKYTVRKKGAYSNYDCKCGLCQSKYVIGDRVVCLPCQHNFHEYCIENWLKWVRSTCPIDKKSINRVEYCAKLGNEQYKPKIQKYTLQEEIFQGGVNEVPETRSNEYSSPNDPRRSLLPVASVASKKCQRWNRSPDVLARKISSVSNKTKRCEVRVNYCSEATLGKNLHGHTKSSQNSPTKDINASPRSSIERNSTLNMKNCDKSATNILHGRNKQLDRILKSFSCKTFSTMNEKAEIEQKSNLEQRSRSDEKVFLRKLIANNSTTFTNALRRTVHETGGWVYKSNVNEFLRKNCFRRK